MKRHSNLFTPLTLVSLSLLLASCSSNEQASKERTRSFDVAEESADSSASMKAAPGVSPSAAPGVAFNYRYAFRVPDAKISAVQEQHAAACETLGLSRCRISGMQYTLEDEDTVNASLAFKLDPLIARKFGKDAIASVEKAEGILVDSAIEGVDVGSNITASQRRSSDLGAELNRIEARLKAGGLGDRERTELQEQSARMREQLDGERDTRREGEASLATTPMEITYRGGEGMPGFDSGNPFAKAAKSAVASAATMIGFVLLAVGVLLPWALLLFGLVFLWRSPILRGVRSWWNKNTPLNDAPASE
jgi:Domain of unknown function (DUF4349)